MKQLGLFSEDYDLDNVLTELALLSDLRDMCIASSQGLTAIATGLIGVDDPRIDVKQLLHLSDELLTLIETSQLVSAKIILAGVYRGKGQ